MIFSVIAIPTFIENSFAQQKMSPHQQWKKFVDPDVLTCKQGHLLLQKTDGTPSCVMPSTYLKLIQRGYGDYDSSIMSKRPEMMNVLMQSMISNQNIMNHWHDMVLKNPNIMTKTMDNWISQVKDNPDLLKNMLGPITSDPVLREKMIEIMENHPYMENSLKMNSKWMDSVHHSMSSGMGQEMHHTACAWCPDYQMSSSHGHSITLTNSDRIMDMMHDLWINSGMSKDVTMMMLQNPSHLAYMSEQMMEPMLNAVMDDEILRQQMIDLMLEHQDFMNSIRHDNTETEN